MEVESVSNKHFGPARERILEDIKQLGFEPQNDRLFQLGFTKLSQNLKYLKRFDGDFDQVAAHLETKRKDKGESEDKPKKHHEYKKDRKERAPREDLPALELKEFTEWPAHIRTLYLDGNNMLYVEDAIRNMVIGRKSKQAEQTLADLAINFAQAIGTFNVVLIFDNTKQIGDQDVAGKNGNTVKFSVVSAAPEFKTSDDALVAWSEKLGDKANECFFVTSDRELQVRLNRNGVENISKTKRWFNLVRSTIGDEKYQAILSNN